MRLATVMQDTSGAPRLAYVRQDGAPIPVGDALRASGHTAATAKLDRILDPLHPGWVGPEGLAALGELARAVDPESLEPLAAGTWRFCPPILKPGKIIATGRNYMDHVREGQEIWAKRGKVVTIPEFPTAFAKYPSSLTGHDAPILMPAGLDDIDYEVELAVVIGRPALDVPEERALDHVAGYTICNDVGARGIQRREMEQQIGIVLAKNFPTFAPMGPWLVTPDEVGDPQRLQVELKVDGDVRQHASTADMIFSVAHLVAYWSRMGLETGDVIITGTPSGVALAREEPQRYYLRAGQVVEATIERIGTLRNRMEPASG